MVNMPKQAIVFSNSMPVENKFSKDRLKLF